ncbi:MAG: YegP family protein [Bacteroidia bacterium]|nr:YegP family protein [Bacteroidia bacterium]MDW8301308.1 YegP family protein [Bacteroidia bacterium]
MGKFVISKRKNGEFQFNLQADNGQTILTSEGYTTKASCINGIESVKKNSTEDDRYERKTSANGKFYFNLKATNGQVIGTSEMYESEESRENGIASVKRNAPDAEIVDQTTSE